LIVLVVITSGCTFLGGGKGGISKDNQSTPVSIDTPALPDQYVAKPVSTATPGTVTLPTRPGDLPLIDAAAKTTINGTGLTGSSNTTDSNTSASIPVARFTSGSAMGYSPLTVQFTDTSPYMPTNWSWDFGDGSYSDLQNPVHTYYDGGQYYVALTAGNAVGSNTLNATNYVSVYKPGFYAYPLSISKLMSVSFTDTGTGYPLPYTWYWDFGDGFTSTQRNATHQYVNAGTYDVNYRVSGIAGTMWINQSSLISVV
jgi:PKD repeat protein